MRTSLRSRRASVLGAAIGLYAFLTCCSSDPPPAPPHDAGPGRDTGLDGGPLADTGTIGDGGGGGGEGGVDANVDGGGGMASCTFDMASDLFELGTDAVMGTRVRTIQVAPGPTGWLVTWASDNGGFEQIYSARIDASTTSVTPVPVTMSFNTALEPVAAWGGTGFVGAWFANGSGGFEIYAQGLGTNGRPVGTPSQITTNTDRDDNPSLAGLGAGARLLWVQQTLDGTRTAYTQAISAAGAAMGAPVALSAPGHSPTQPVIAARMDGGFAVGWVDPLATQDAVVVPLSAAGVAESTPVVLSSEHNANGALDLSLNDGTVPASQGVAVFGTLRGGSVPEVRAVGVDAVTLTPVGVETILTSGAERGSDATVANIFGGIAVAYRALDASQLRVRLYTYTLNQVDSADLVSIAAAGGRLTMRASDDGNLLIAWADQVGTTIRVRAARLRCS